jgi:hypothetical protein
MTWIKFGNNLTLLPEIPMTDLAYKLEHCLKMIWTDERVSAVLKHILNDDVQKGVFGVIFYVFYAFALYETHSSLDFIVINCRYKCTFTKLFEISGSHGDVYEGVCLLGCCTVQPSRNIPTFQDDCTDNGGTKHLWNVGHLLLDYTA